MNKKNYKHILSIFLIVLTSMLLSGCWQRKELNETAFVLGLGIDKAQNGYKVTLQVVIPSAISSQESGGSGGGAVPIDTTTVTVPTIYETPRKYLLEKSRDAYYGHIRVLVIGEELARSGVGRILDVFQRSREPRNEFYVMVAKGATAENVLKILTPVDKIPANKLFQSLDQSHKLSARTDAVHLNTFIEDLVSEGINPVLTGVKIIGDVDQGGNESNLKRSTPPTNTVYENVAVFKKDKMIGWLNDSETVGYNYVTNNVINSFGPVEGNDGRPIVIDALNSKTKRKVKVIDGIPHIYLDVSTLCNVQEVMSTDNLEDENVIKELEKKSQEKILQRMKESVENVVRKYNVDIFGFGRSIYHAYPKVWRKLQEKNNNDYLSVVPIHYKVKVDINRIGITDKSFIQDIKH